MSTSGSESGSAVTKKLLEDAAQPAHTHRNVQDVLVDVGLSLLALIFFGTRNWLLSYVGTSGWDNADITSSIWGWLGTGIMGGLIALVLEFTRFRVDAGPPAGAALPFGRVAFMLPLFLGGVGSALGLVSLNAGYALAPDAKGQISAVSASVSAFVALFTFVALREALTWPQALGILVTIAGVVVISVEADESTDWLALAMGVVTAVLESLCNVAIGYCVLHGMCVVSNGVVLAVLIGLDVIFGAPVALAIWGSPFEGLADPATGEVVPWLLLTSLGAGALSAFGLLTQNIAISRWSTGAVSAITNSNAIVVMLWDYAILGATYSWLAICGVFVIIAGTAVLAVAPKSSERWGAAPCRRAQ
eukprot:gnl/Chilomastix_cuspidata/3710.p1 GENE.gnl/Chilomastix_cuspidata/3710~~gnl/Chilomastix_cuspidata/3710.p1  ORF type:complete len:361 (+),score=172.35 gnl/Chilomastix_cuspidata/3710:762-1844(+)